jgi:hypothetical protein
LRQQFVRPLQSRLGVGAVQQGVPAEAE